MFDKKGEDAPRRPPRPKDAATLVVVDRTKGERLVLMGQRHGSTTFMPNKVVFPGGRVDACDYRIKPSKGLRAEVAAKLVHEGETTAPERFALAALRETFEETGFLIGEEWAGSVPTRSPAWRAFYEAGVAPRLDRLDFIARAITPPYRHKRFDARFFMVDASAIVKQVASPSPEELLDIHWVPLEKARTLDLPTITRRVLDEVERRLARPHGPHPIPFFKVIHGKPTFLEL